MKRITQGLSLLLILFFFASAFGEEEIVLRFNHCLGGDHPGWIAFHARHPETSWTFSESDYQDTDELLADIQAGTFDADLYFLYSFNDYRKLIQKGACVDLTDVPGVYKALERMNPIVREQAMMDGRIYALPASVRFDYWMINRKNWEAAGLGSTPVPDTLPVLFDFLESWLVQYQQMGPCKFRVIGYWDGTVYDAWDYARQLIRWVVDGALLQKTFQKEPLFLDAEIIPLLERARRVGKAIYEAERPAALREGFEGCKSLLEPGVQINWPELEDVLFMRVHKTQPKLIRGLLDMTAVSASACYPELAKELLGDAAENEPGWIGEYRYAEMDGAPDFCSNYQDMLCFMGGNALNSGRGLGVYRELENQFAKGEMNAEQFAAEINALLGNGK